MFLFRYKAQQLFQSRWVFGASIYWLNHYAVDLDTVCTVVPQKFDKHNTPICTNDVLIDEAGELWVIEYQVNNCTFVRRHLFSKNNYSGLQNTQGLTIVGNLHTPIFQGNSLVVPHAVIGETLELSEDGFCVEGHTVDLKTVMVLRNESWVKIREYEDGKFVFGNAENEFIYS